MKNSIIVTWDFTILSEYALDAAIKLSEKTNDKIQLIHIIDKDSEKTAKEKLLKSVCKEVSEKYQKDIQYIVQKGTIFQTINHITEKENASLVVMGTRGIKGLQKFTGSWALKVIEGSKVPFLVVQDKVTNNKDLRIVMPFDFKKENKEKLTWVNYFVKHYKSKIYIFSKKYKDSSLVNKLNSNITVAKAFFKKENINFELIETSSSSKFEEEIIRFSGSVTADIIVLTTTRIINKAAYILGLPEQHLIANNAKIPVLVVNPSIKTNSKFTPY